MGLSLADLGFFSPWADDPDRRPDWRAARIAAQHYGRYQVLNEDGPAWAALPGRLKKNARNRLDEPAVGDWVWMRPAEIGREALGSIQKLMPRRSALVRQAAGLRVEPQVIAANVDEIFLVTSANQDFNPRRLERYLTLIAESGAAPVLVLSKVDLAESVDTFFEAMGEVAAQVPVIALSARDGRGISEIEARLQPGHTVALVGSSGVGKSTLTNLLLGESRQSTLEIRESDDRGRHATSHRELIPIPGPDGWRGLLIDTPGLREIQLWGGEEGLEESFDDVQRWAESCRFRDCGHQGEPGCAVQAAIDQGELSADRLSAYQKLHGEVEQGRRGLETKQMRNAMRNAQAVKKAKRGY